MIAIAALLLITDFLYRYSAAFDDDRSKLFGTYSVRQRFANVFHYVLHPVVGDRWRSLENTNRLVTRIIASFDSPGYTVLNL